MTSAAPFTFAKRLLIVKWCGELEGIPCGDTGINIAAVEVTRLIFFCFIL
jgi:hypothetical protein